MNPIKALRVRPRLVMAIALAVSVGVLLPSSWRPATRAILAFDAGIVLYLIAAFRLMARADIARLKTRARSEDEGATAILVLTVFSALASLAAIAVQLGGLGDLPPSEGKAPHLALAGVTIVLSWFFVHLIFAIHYAHEFYSSDRDDGSRGGLDFPKESEPDYVDFLYFSVTIGAAAQTSDVAISSRSMRRLVLAHTVLSFLFNTTVLALAINVGASLISSK